jgi:predicted HTH transcriptional regulator
VLLLIECFRTRKGRQDSFRNRRCGPLVAFANTAGGVLLIGVEDRTRPVVGVADPVAVEERLASLVNDSIAPTSRLNSKCFPGVIRNEKGRRVWAGAGRGWQ